MRTFDHENNLKWNHEALALQAKVRVCNRDGVLEEVLGLEDTF